MVTMKYVSAIVRAMLLVALLGMLIAPVSTAAANYAMSDMVAAAGSHTLEMTGMQAEMPCCPEEQPVKPDCDQSCPFIIICSTFAPLALLKADWTSAALSWSPHVYAYQRFERLASLTAKPPARPPRA
jgi:hypothetical protein